MNISKAYQTNIVLSAGLLIIGFYLKYKEFDIAHYFHFAALFILILSALNEKLALLIAKWWMKLGEFMGKISSTIVLTIVFFVFLTPLALLKKMFTKTNFDKNTTWIEVNKKYSAESFTKPW